MFRLLIAAAVAVGAWVLLRQTRKPGGPPTGGGRRHNKTDTLMVIQLVGGKPTITRGPETLTPKKGVATKLTWHVRNETEAAQEISVRNFRKKPKPDGDTPVRTDPLTRTVQAGVTMPLVNDLVADPVVATYKYDVWLNGREAIDPDVQIWEEGG